MTVGTLYPSPVHGSRFTRVALQNNWNDFGMQKMMSQIWYLALSELQLRYIATRIGFLWAIIQPTVLFGVFWFVSVYGLKMGVGADGPPYFAVLFCGLLPWMTLNEAIGGASGCLRARKHLIMEKVASPIVLVASTALSAIIMQIPLFLIVAVIFAVSGIEVTASWVVIVYYFFGLASLCFAVSCFVAPLAARNADVGPAINTLLTVWFWVSPIVWPVAIIPANILVYLRINPFFYIIEGYRGSLLYQDPFGGTFYYGLFFWLTIIAIFATGLWLLRRTGDRLAEWLER